MSLAGACLTAQAVSGMEVARAWSRALVRNVGTCRPDAGGRPVGGCGLRLVAGARTPSGRNREGQSSDAGHRGGPPRSSDEAW